MRVLSPFNCYDDHDEGGYHGDEEDDDHQGVCAFVSCFSNRSAACTRPAGRLTTCSWEKERFFKDTVVSFFESCVSVCRVRERHAVVCIALRKAASRALHTIGCRAGCLQATLKTLKAEKRTKGKAAQSATAKKNAAAMKKAGKGIFAKKQLSDAMAAICGAKSLPRTEVQQVFFSTDPGVEPLVSVDRIKLHLTCTWTCT